MMPDCLKFLDFVDSTSASRRAESRGRCLSPFFVSLIYGVNKKLKCQQKPITVTVAHPAVAAPEKLRCEGEWEQEVGRIPPTPRGRRGDQLAPSQRQLSGNIPCRKPHTNKNKIKTRATLGFKKHLFKKQPMFNGTLVFKNKRPGFKEQALPKEEKKYIDQVSINLFPKALGLNRV